MDLLGSMFIMESKLLSAYAKMANNTEWLPVKRFEVKQSKRKNSKAAMKRGLKILKRTLTENADEFCKNTTLHGLKYVTDPELYPLERLYFAIAFVGVVALSFLFTVEVVHKWNRTPVIFGNNPEQSFITDEPFPAVTICNLNVASKSQVEQYSIFSTEYAMLQMLCKREVNVSIATTITNWNNVDRFVEQINQPCSRLLLDCEFGAVKYNCTDLFTQIITDEGMCCSFNLVHPYFIYNPRGFVMSNATNTAKVSHVQWTSEDGYPAELPNNFSPYKVPGVGETLSLRLVLDVQAHEYYCSSSNSIGFKILLHSPTEVPSLREVGLLLPPGYETKARIRVEKYDSEKKLRSVRPRFRQCYFQAEIKLMFYRFYTQRNCESECLTNMTLQYCGCVAFFMVQPYPNVSICSLYDLQCVEHVRVAAAECSRKCLPSCFDLTFFPDFFSSPLRKYEFELSNQVLKNFSADYIENNIAVVHLFYKESSYRSLKQTEFINATDVLSSIGGLIGLFFGFSFISVAELIFFALIRPFRRARIVRDSEPPTDNHESLNTGVVVENNLVIPFQETKRKRYKRELGFNDSENLNNPEAIEDIDISKLYMPREFRQNNLKIDDIVEKWYSRKQVFM